MNLFKPLTDSDINRIMKGSLEILEKVGFLVEHEGLVSSLRKAGARVDDADGRVRGVRGERFPAPVGEYTGWKH